MPFVDYECAGLVLRSAIQIVAARALPAPASERLDVVRIELGASRPVPAERPSDDVVAELVRDGITWWSICRIGDSYVARFYSVGDFEISAGLDRVTCRPSVGGHPELIPVLLTGAIVALLLTLRGRCVLHASAVEVGGRAIAFIGSSGQGKTTVAALLCAAGAPLVTDDVLPVDFGEGELQSVGVLRAGNELRLRPKARDLLEYFDAGTAERITADERHAIAPTVTASPRLELAAIVVPLPDRERSSVQCRRMSVADGALWLGRCARVEGWRRHAELERHFVDVTRILSSVPVFELAIPWGPPFARGLAGEILDALS